MNSPYARNYGLRWPSSGIISDVYRNINRIPSLSKGIDFGCGLGAHGRFMETLGFSEMFYVDRDEVALQKAQKFLCEFPYNGKRFFYNDLGLLKGSPIDLVIDRASLQHVDRGHVESILNEIAVLLMSTKETLELTRGGILVSEWILEAEKSSQTKRFSEIIFYNEIEEMLLARFDLLDITYRDVKQVANGLTSSYSVVNVVLKSNQ